MGTAVDSTNGTGGALAPRELLLADDLFLAAHDDVSGKPRLPARAAGLGLAAALLGELVMFRRITLRRGDVVVLEKGPVPDALAHLVFEEVRREPEPAPVWDWLTYLAEDAYQRVAERMVRQGLLAPQTKRLRRAGGYQPVDLNAAAWPLVRLAQKLAREEPVVLPDIVLAGLVRATGLNPYLRAAALADVTTYQQRLVAQLPTPLRVLVAEAEGAVGEAVLRRRR
ncbi:MAG TPA: GPP34 family phosphoprotein [Actinophytocola sp.]|uniref:GOLPH3/VPS74 family protein n=1 Tax=Actinophytocola sp. TaxID=1872138 RepID=UPI002DBC239A|nr:GPP34 family phosphoprotein [Actinophytocola sp.]HEU5469027.1 GPP34 family phosphoprotein [Actinophytocola sp.]